MRNIFNKVLAGVVTTTLVATLAVGFHVGTKDVKAEVTNVITSNWTNAAPSYEPSDALIANTKFTSTADSISADISITGWQAQWIKETPAPDDAIVVGDGDGKIWGEKPYQITSTNKAKIVPGNTYKLKFTVENGMKVAESETPTEKNITVTVNSGIEGDNDNTFLFKTVTVPASQTKTFEFDVPISGDYLSDDVQIQLAYGSYFYSYTLTQAVKSGSVSEADAKACKYAYAYGTTENVNAHGTLKFTDISFMGEKQTGSVIPPKETTKAPSTSDKPGVTPGTPDKPGVVAPPVTVKKLAKVKKLKAVSKKKGTVKVTWQKVKNAKTYQVKVGKKTYNTKKAKLTVKKVKKGKVVVKVRAKAAGFKTSAWATKKVKVK